MKNVLFLFGFICLFGKVHSQVFHWKTIGEGISEGIPSGVSVINGKLYVSGSYTVADGHSVNNFSVIEGDYFIETGDIPGAKTFAYGYANGTVYALCNDSPRYVYYQVDSGDEWIAAPITFNEQPRFVYSLNDSELIITGEFTLVNGMVRNYLCVWNVVSGAVLDIGGLPGPIMNGHADMCKYMGKLLIPYNYPSVGDPHFKVLNMNTLTFESDSGLGFPCQSLHNLFADSAVLYMSCLGYYGTEQIVKYENASWTVISTPDVAGANGFAMDNSGDLLACGVGSLDSVLIPSYVARYDGTWHDFGESPGGYPAQILTYDGTLYAIGNLWKDGIRTGIMRWTLETGISSADEHSAVTFFPNPASDAITIRVEPNTLIQLTDLSGRTLQMFRTVTNQTVIDISRLLPGMYLLKCNEEIEQKVIVVH